MADPDGTIDGSHARAVGLTSAYSPQGTPAADRVTRGQTLGAGGEGVTHVNRVTEKLKGRGEGERGREREREGGGERERGREREIKREGIGISAYQTVANNVPFMDQLSMSPLILLLCVPFYQGFHLKCR